jgi:hypothetical protein
VLEEFDSGTRRFTGECCKVEITSITSTTEPCAISSEALDPAFCILSIRRVAEK